MEYIIFDLEWNNAFNYRTQKGINEIIEIGAVKLNENFEVIDTFKQLIYPRLSKKLGSNFKKLTHITMEEIRADGISFDEAFADFSRWSRGNDVVFLSWSNSDLYTLADNYKRFKNTSNVAFMHYYADAQSYCMQFISDHNGSQISLSKCAEKFGVDVDTAKFHRALEDCFVTAYCLEKVFDKDKFKNFIVKCDALFFERLVFKSYFINKPVYGDFDVNKVELKCPACSGTVSPFGKYEFSNNTFRNSGVCNECGKKFWLFVRAKQTYDELIITQRLVAINKKRARFIN